MSIMPVAAAVAALVSFVGSILAVQVYDLFDWGDDDDDEEAEATALLRRQPTVVRKGPAVASATLGAAVDVGFHSNAPAVTPARGLRRRPTPSSSSVAAAEDLQTQRDGALEREAAANRRIEELETAAATTAACMQHLALLRPELRATLSSPSPSKAHPERHQPSRGTPSPKKAQLDDATAIVSIEPSVLREEEEEEEPAVQVMSAAEGTAAAAAAAAASEGRGSRGCSSSEEERRLLDDGRITEGRERREGGEGGAGPAAAAGAGGGGGGGPAG
jgi:hypothetical protein